MKSHRVVINFITNTSAIKMSAMTGSHPDTKMTVEQRYLVQEAILQKIWKCQSGKGAKSNHNQKEFGMVHFHWADNNAAEWLRKVVPQLNLWKVLPSKDIS